MLLFISFNLRTYYLTKSYLAYLKCTTLEYLNHSDLALNVKDFPFTPLLKEKELHLVLRTWFKQFHISFSKFYYWSLLISHIFSQQCLRSWSHDFLIDYAWSIFFVIDYYHVHCHLWSNCIQVHSIFIIFFQSSELIGITSLTYFFD